jgi:hypothetical protein
MLDKSHKTRERTDKAEDTPASPVKTEYNAEENTKKRVPASITAIQFSGWLLQWVFWSAFHSAFWLAFLVGFLFDFLPSFLVRFSSWVFQSAFHPAFSIGFSGWVFQLAYHPAFWLAFPVGFCGQL